VQLAVLNALGRFGDPAVGEALLDRYPSLGADLKGRVLDLLSSRKAWAGSLLDAIAAKRIPAADLRPAHALQIVQLGDRGLIARVEEVWGKAPTANSPEKVKRIAEVRGMLVEGDKGDAARGRLVFRESCAGCHRLFGEGEAIGPDLTGAERGNLDFLLTSLVDPSALIRKEYQAQTVATRDGRILSGLVVEESAGAITLFDSRKQRTVIPRDAIEETTPAAVSLMPEGLIETLREEQVRDLFKYLQSSGPSAGKDDLPQRAQSR
jgi:putative heme-binding domain-containing protein